MYKDLPFKERVLTAVSNIPKGSVATYSEIADRSGSPRAYRAVGSIMKKNTDPSIPCHRVIRSSGELGEYNGLSGSKNSLLAQEGYKINQ